MTVHIPAETFHPQDEAAPGASRRQDGWSAANQRLFLEAIAEGHGVDAACARVGLSASSAYAFRRTAKGSPFALGWRAAALVARDCVAETLMVRALAGQIDTVTRADGSTITRHRHDNRLGMALLSRLDRQIEVLPDADAQAARLVAQEFDAYLGVIEREEGAARAGLFLARRADGWGDGGEGIARDLTPIYALAAADRLVRTGVSTAAEVNIADLDPNDRAHWSAEQWQRAEAAGLLALAGAATEEAEHGLSSGDIELREEERLLDAQASQHSQHSAPIPEDEDGPEDDELPEDDTQPIWWNEKRQAWRTTYPPPDGFDGFEQNGREQIHYQRGLTLAEVELHEAFQIRCSPGHLAAFAEERDEYFARIAQDLCMPMPYSHLDPELYDPGPEPQPDPPAKPSKALALARRIERRAERNRAG